eukprot:1152332-Pelagomonas_calceolata.AAC.14
MLMLIPALASKRYVRIAKAGYSTKQLRRQSEEKRSMASNLKELHSSPAQEPGQEKAWFSFEYGLISREATCTKERMPD